MQGNAKKRNVSQEVQEATSQSVTASGIASGIAQIENQTKNKNTENITSTVNDNDKNKNANNRLVDENENNVTYGDNEQAMSTSIWTGNIFSIDHSIRGTAKCVSCKKVIARLELRIGKLTPYKSSSILRYMHVGCAFESFKRARIAKNTVTSIEQLDGVDSLNEYERKYIENLIKVEKDTRKKNIAK